MSTTNENSATATEKAYGKRKSQNLSVHKAKRQRSSDHVVPTIEEPILAAESSFTSQGEEETDGNDFVIPKYFSTQAPVEDPKWICTEPRSGWPETTYDRWTDMYRKYE